MSQHNHPITDESYDDYGVVRNASGNHAFLEIVDDHAVDPEYGCRMCNSTGSTYSARGERGLVWSSLMSHAYHVDGPHHTHWLDVIANTRISVLRENRFGRRPLTSLEWESLHR